MDRQSLDEALFQIKGLYIISNSTNLFFNLLLFLYPFTPPPVDAYILGAVMRLNDETVLNSKTRLLHSLEITKKKLAEIDAVNKKQL